MRLFKELAVVVDCYWRIVISLPRRSAVALTPRRGSRGARAFREDKEIETRHAAAGGAACRRCAAPDSADRGGAAWVHQSAAHPADGVSSGGRVVLARAAGAASLSMGRSAADPGDVPEASLGLGGSAVLS